MRRLASLAIVALACLALVMPTASASNARGPKAPEIAITDGIHGMTAKSTVAEHLGSPVLLVMWIPVCPHCKKFVPDLQALYAKYAAKGLKVVTVTWGKKDYTVEFMKEKGFNFPVGFDWTGTTTKRFGLGKMPGIRLIGADGHLREVGGTSELAPTLATLEAAIQAELPAPATK